MSKEAPSNGSTTWLSMWNVSYYWRIKNPFLSSKLSKQDLSNVHVSEINSILIEFNNIKPESKTCTHQYSLQRNKLHPIKWIFHVVFPLIPNGNLEKRKTKQFKRINLPKQSSWKISNQQNGNIPKGGQRQILCTGSWVLRSCQSMHKAGLHKRTGFQFPLLHGQCDEPFTRVLLL